MFCFLQVVVTVLPARPVNYDFVQFSVSYDAMRQRPIVVSSSSFESSSVPAGLARLGWQTGPAHLPRRKKEHVLKEKRNINNEN